MHTVVMTMTFLRDAREAGLSDDEVLEIATTVAADPLAGDLMPGTGGARKLRHRARGTGKRGGIRTVHYFAGEDLPAFLLAVFRKGDKGNLSQAERNTLASVLPRLAGAYRDRSSR